MKPIQAVGGAAPSRRRRGVPGRSVLAAGLALALAVCAAGVGAQAYRELIDLSLEELADIRVTSVSKQSERVGDAPASVYVITRDDIRRSGAITLPEALRLAPNLQVARNNARDYAISSRGFNSVLENKLLVMIDGRSVYSPLYSGVFWDAQDVLLEDVDRIEVVSGAGGTTWGANAVNGVINVITRSADKAQGDLASVGGGSEGSTGGFRHGGQLPGGAGHYSVQGTHVAADDLQRERGGSAHDGWHRSRAGFRIDGGEAGHSFTLQGDAYTARLHKQAEPDYHLNGANVLGRFNRRLSAQSDLQLQAYIDHTERRQTRAAEWLDTVDVELQHSVALNAAHRLVWGGGHRVAMERVQNDLSFAFFPDAVNLRWSNVFVQDEWSPHPKVKITGGWKIERNIYTGPESLPSLRVAWKPADEHLWWASWSRAVRAPSRIDRDLYTPRFAGGPNFQSETVRTLELGYRGRPAAAWSYSITAFQSEYDRLRSVEVYPSAPLSMFGNLAQGRARGAEMWGSWQAAKTWRVSGGLVVQALEQNFKPGATLTRVSFEDGNPRHYWNLRLSGDLSARTEFDLMFRSVGRLRQPAVPAYEAVDMRVGWKVLPHLEISLTGRNLLDAAHSEYGNANTRSEFDRGVFVKLLWQP